MNWVGGARSRIKIKQEKKQQQDFFEKKRFTKRITAEGSKANQNNISQDLIFLQTVANCSNSRIAGCNTSLVKKINLEGKFTLQCRKTPVELPMSPTAFASQLKLAGPQDDQPPCKSLRTTNFKGNKGRTVPVQNSSQVTLLRGNQLPIIDNGNMCAEFPSNLDFLNSFHSEGNVPGKMNYNTNSSYFNEDFQETTVANSDPSISPSSLEQFKTNRNIGCIFNDSKPQIITEKHGIEEIPSCISGYNGEALQQSRKGLDQLEERSNWTFPSSSSQLIAKRYKFQRRRNQGSATPECSSQSDASSCIFTDRSLNYYNPDVFMYQTQPFLPSKDVTTQSFHTMQQIYIGSNGTDSNDSEEESSVSRSTEMHNTSFSFVKVAETLHPESAVVLMQPPRTILPESPVDTRDWKKGPFGKEHTSHKDAEISNLKIRLEQNRKSDMLEEFLQLEESNILTHKKPEPNSVRKDFEKTRDENTDDLKNSTGVDQKMQVEKVASVANDIQSAHAQILTDYSEYTSSCNVTNSINSAINLVISPNTHTANVDRNETVLGTASETTYKQRMKTIGIQCKTQLVDANTQTSPLPTCSNCIVAAVLKDLTNAVASYNL